MHDVTGGHGQRAVMGVDEEPAEFVDGLSGAHDLPIAGKAHPHLGTECQAVPSVGCD